MTGLTIQHPNKLSTGCLILRHYSPRVSMLLLCVGLWLASTEAYTADIFDMEAIRDAKTLETQILQPWKTVPGMIATRQLLVTINVGQIWPGQDYRIPIRMVVPADR